jgi:hypothetical protein
VDPAQEGCQSFEATDFLLRRRTFSTASALVLWQVGVIGEFSVRTTRSYDPQGVRLLARRLRRYYASDHEVVIYEAAQYPVCEPSIVRVRLGDLHRQAMPPIATLYVPPRSRAAADLRVLAQLRRRTA